MVDIVLSFSYGTNCPPASVAAVLGVAGSSWVAAGDSSAGQLLVLEGLGSAHMERAYNSR